MTFLKTVCLALAVGLIPWCARAADLGVAHVSLLDGDVQVKPEGAGAWLPAAVNFPLAGGDRLWVPARGRVELQARDGSYLRLNEHSALEILTLQPDSYQFYLSAGRGYVNFRGRRDYFLQLDTPVASLRVYDKALFRIDVTDSGDTRVTVVKGAVEAENRYDRVRVGAGKSVRLRPDARPELSAAAPPDDWEHWNAWRDMELNQRRASAQYLPDELESYAPDFDAHGRWVSSADYGNVWIPTVVVSAGWSPYRVGRWVWIGSDYVWVSYEPWGWAPYHYGRWAYAGHLGWCWVPPLRGAVYWGPGYVGWTHHHNHVAWVPLAPGELYYGHGHYGPHSVNLLHLDVRNATLRPNYKNARALNGVTTLHRDSFVTGRPAEVKLKQNLFLTEAPSLGRPDIAPQPATRLPVVKEIPRAQQPPPTVRELPVRDIKEARPLVKDRSTPVLKSEPRERAAPATAPRTPSTVQPKTVERVPETRPSERPPVAREVKPQRSTEVPPNIGAPPREQLPVQKTPEPGPSPQKSGTPTPVYTVPRPREAPQEKPPGVSATERSGARPVEIKKPQETPAKQPVPYKTPSGTPPSKEDQERVEGGRLR